MQAPRAPGNVVTFYSYKGGTGRTMALANTACVLTEFERASADGVLVIDWDLEAPGLHRFFPPRLRAREAALDLGLDDQPGLIDLMIELRDRLPAELPADAEGAAEAASRALDATSLYRFIAPTEVPGVSMMRAGRDDDGGYGRRVATFDWEGLFERAPTLYRELAARLAATYRWVLVDSRTGVTDISGICTSLLPEKLVVVFTPNRQSLSGVRELVQRAVAYRAGSDDLRPLLVYPLPSRIEASLERLSRHWRYGNPGTDIVGYQPMFKELLAECYGLDDCNLQEYFDAVQIQQTPDAAYGELIAVLEGSADRLSLASSYRVFVKRLTGGRAPWEVKQAVLPEPTPAPAPPSLLVDPDPFADAPPGAAASGASVEDLFGLGSAAALPSGAPGSPLASDPFDELAVDSTLLRPPPRSAPAAQRRPTVFASHAAPDAAKVAPLLKALEAEGFRVSSGSESLHGAGSYTTLVTRLIDASDVVIVFWSRASVESRAVEAEVLEGMRRGVLVPVLLDDALPPLAMRHILAVDLNRGGHRGVEELVDAVRRVAARKPGDSIAPPPYEADPMAGRTLPAQWPGPAPAPMAMPTPSVEPVRPPHPQKEAHPRSSVPARVLIGVFGALMLAVLAGVALWQRNASSPLSPPDHTQIASARVGAPPLPLAQVTVPAVINLASDVAEAAVKAAGLSVVLQDAASDIESRTLDGIVVGQVPAARSSTTAGSVVRLKVATKVVDVPSLVGATLSEALARLRANGLEFGRVESVSKNRAPVGTVVAQEPPVGQRVAAGSRVNVSVAGGPARPPSPNMPK